MSFVDLLELPKSFLSEYFTPGEGVKYSFPQWGAKILLHSHASTLYFAHYPSHFTARRSYASAVLGVVILSVRPSVRLSVCHTRAL